jgi:hypothetical protein
MPEAVVKNRLSKPIESLAIDKKNLLRLLLILQERADAACEMECNYIRTITSEDELEQSLADLSSCSILNVTITGLDGEELFGTIEEVFDSVSFPEQIKTVFVNSELIYKARFNYFVRNRFDLFIDFGKPKVLDFTFLPSEATPNNSAICVEGYDNTWVNGVYSEIDHFLKKRSSKFSRIHKNSFYDLIVWVIGIPFGFWICNKIDFNINDGFNSSFLKNALFVYVFMFSLTIFRVLFHYFRWLYPKVQYKSSTDLSLAHQSFFYIITMGIIGTFLYDVLSSFFS